MTARQQIRVGRRIGRDRATVEASSAPSVGDLLHAAREKKGVDLYRAERDTKIRARHLAALEAGDYAELPGSVYVKGFLRNYAQYLGLDPAEVLERWHDDQEPVSRAPAAAVIPPPQPLTDPRSGLTLTPGVLVASFLAVVILVFMGYVGLQLARFSQVPVLSLDGPSVIEAALDQTSVTLHGTAPAGATVDAFDAVQHPAGSTVADGGGRWTLELAVRKGQNDFVLRTRDPETGRDADPRAVVVNVPVDATPGPSATPAPTPFAALPGAASATPGPTLPAGASPDAAASPTVAAPATVELTSPREGATHRDATLAVRGRSDAESVRISARWVGSGRRPGVPDTLEVPVRRGAFEQELVLAPGRWDIVVTTAGDGVGNTEVTHRIRVEYDGFPVVVGAREKGRVWIQIWVDGVALDAGGILERGDRTVVQALDSVVIRTGNERQTVVGVDGDAPAQLSSRAGAGTWSIQKGREPVKTR
jgi:cytoskeletal protein RodZ